MLRKLLLAAVVTFLGSSGGVLVDTGMQLLVGGGGGIVDTGSCW